MSVLVTALVVFAQIPLGLWGVWCGRIWAEGPAGLGDGDCSSASHFTPVASNNQVVFLCLPHFSAFCPAPGHCRCVEVTALSVTAVQGICHTFYPHPLPSWSLSYERQLLCFSQSTDQLPCFCPVVALICRFLTQTCLCADWVFFVES